MLTPDLLPERMRDRIHVDENGCWIWSPAAASGYGSVHMRLDGKRQWLTHRLVWRLLIGEPPPHLHHRCRVKACCNPLHLVATHAAEHNVMHMRDECVNGHELTEANAYQRRDGGGRQCRRCKAERQRARHAARAQQENRARTERRRRARAMAAAE